MKFQAIVGLVIALNVLVIQAGLIKFDKWNDLKIKWGFDTYSPDLFISLPRTVKEAVHAGWRLAKDCSQFNGNKYILDDNVISQLIFDENGIIAGISASIPKNMPYNFPSKHIKGFFVDEDDSLSFTAYFVDPKTVCQKSSARLSTGDRLVIKGSEKELNIPMYENEITSFWTKGQCYHTMGVHYWANVKGVPLTVDADPDEFVPLFLQYNNGYLNGFGWAFNGNISTPMSEHPIPQILPMFFKEVPNFMSDKTKADVLTTLHIFLDSTPQLNRC